MPPLLPQSAPRHEAEAQNPNLINIGTPCAASPRGSVAIISHKDAENAPHSTLARFGPVFSLILGLVDPSGMAKHLADDLGSEAASFAEFWREKQLEYSFRRGLMQNYADFSICTSDALNFTCRRFKVSISSERRAELLGLYQHLPRFDDVTPALQSLQTAFRLFAFSNGKRSQIDAVLSNADILVYFEGLVSADDVRSFKPSPAVYSYARRVTGAWSSPFWLISSNPWDVIGARSAGLSSAWVQRSDEKIYDTWGVEPNISVRSLIYLPAALADGTMLPENPTRLAPRL